MSTAGSRVLLLCTALLLILISPLVGQSIPTVTADSLDGRSVSLPGDLAGKPAILIVGFTKAAGDQCGAFARRLYKEPSVVNGTVKVYQIAMLAAAPRFVRPMILHGMRGSVPKAEQSMFVPLYKGEKEWKQAASFLQAGENDSYLLLVDPQGRVRWSGHGRYSDALYDDFKAHLLPEMK